jgi:hypothetical protein
VNPAIGAEIAIVDPEPVVVVLHRDKRLRRGFVTGVDFHQGLIPVDDFFCCGPRMPLICQDVDAAMCL